MGLAWWLALLLLCPALFFQRFCIVPWYVTLAIIKELNP